MLGAGGRERSVVVVGVVAIIYVERAASSSRC